MELGVGQDNQRLGPAVHPLGPLLVRLAPARHNRFRPAALVRAVVFSAPLCVAAFLTPDPSGLGTHRGLGYGDCPFVVAHGVACPTCGMTTAFAHTVRGQWIRAFHAQPMGWLLAVAAIVVAGTNVFAFVTGASIGINWYRVSPIAVALAMVVLGALAWGYKAAFGGVVV